MIMGRLLSRILGTLAAPFGAIVANREEAGAGAGDSTGVGGSRVDVTSTVVSASATLRRFVSSVNDRVGGAPFWGRFFRRPHHKRLLRYGLCL